MRPTNFLRGALRWLVGASAALVVLGSQAAVEGLSGSAAGGTRTFNLFAADGYISAADGQQIYMWGYGAPAAYGGTGLMQISGPTLKVQQGETVNVIFTNNLPTPTSILFPGQSGISASGGSAGVLAQEAAPGQTITYSFTASQPGTYLYQSGTQPGLQVEMGLVGALIVYPTGAGVPSTGNTKWAYNHPGTAYERETLFVVSDVDSDIHAAVDEQVRTFKASNGYQEGSSSSVFSADLSRRFPKYWLLNGRTSPDVFAKNFAGELPHQPYNALPRLHPGERMLLRMVGAGSDLHPMHHHGNNSWAIARDGRMLSSDPVLKGPNLAMSDYTIRVVPGQTYDAVWTWTGAGLGWDVFGATCSSPNSTSTSFTPTYDNCRFGTYNASTGSTQPPQRKGACRLEGQPIPNTTLTYNYANCPDALRYTSPQAALTDWYRAMPVKLPSEFELAYGEFYSGSPYLGDFGIRPVGTGQANTTGGYFHMFHSHNEREVVNGGIFPGGMMTMLVIEPLSVTIETSQP